MRWTRRALAVFFLLLAVYTVWPFVDLYRLGRAIETGDIAEVARRVDLTAVRISVTRQVADTYLQRSGKDAKLGGFVRGLVAGVVTAASQPLLVQITSPERVVDLFSEGWPRSAFAGDRRGRIRFVPRGLGALWRVYADSDYRLRYFHVFVPPDVPKEERFGLTLYFAQWRWKLREVRLPQTLRIRLADEMIKAMEKKK